MNDLWQALKRVRELNVDESPASVEVEIRSEHEILFYERGEGFFNTLKWTRRGNSIALERGERDFGSFAKRGENLWVLDRNYICSHDVYKAEIALKTDSIELTWRIKGPKKDQRVCFLYAIEPFFESADSHPHEKEGKCP